jgi:murein hydrolase activator
VLRRLLLILAICPATLPCAAQLVAGNTGSTARQSLQQFESELRDLRSKISADERSLERTRTEETASLRMLRRLNRDITLREKVVRSFEGRISQLTLERDSIYTQVQLLSEEIEALRAEYRARATHAYKYGRLHDLALVLSATSINQMLVRVHYLSRFSDARTRQLEDINTTTIALDAHQADLTETLGYTEETLVAARKERENLFDQKRERERLVRRLRTQSGALEAQLAERRRAEQDLAARLAALVASERRRLAEAAGSDFNAADYAALTGSFETNRGRLPWPAHGTMVEQFGVHVNAEYGTRTTNQGIVVATTPGADVRSVFEGRVLGVDVMPVYGRFVMVSHGDYVTVYGNLSTVYVTPQQLLTAGQLVGKAGTEQEPYGAGYFFGLSKDGFVDPAGWLAR